MRNIDPAQKPSVLRLLWLGARSAVFYLVYIVLTLWFGFTAGLFGRWLSYRANVAYINTWNFLVVWWLRVICGVRYRVEGLENIPAQRPYVILAKHQSQWETFFLQLPFAPACTILKQELLDMPVFGWGLATVKPIGIDRSAPREALKKIISQGCERLHAGICVLVFPEGTRIPVGSAGRYARSGVDLAQKVGVPLLPVAHNAGECWPSGGFIKYPGDITVVIGKSIASDSADSRALITHVQTWIEAEVRRVSQYTPE